MQNDMVSIPSANMNGGLKAANSSGTVVGVGVGVTGTVLTNAQRVYLTPASNYHLASARQTVATSGVVTGTATGTNVNVNVVATAKANNNNISATTAASGTGPTTSGATGAVRYFSQFSKLQPGQQLNATSVGQRKLINGDTMVLVNGSKPLIISAPVNNINNSNKLLTAVATVPNGNRVFLGKQQQLQLQQQQQQKQQQPSSVIEEVDHTENATEGATEIEQGEVLQQQQSQPVALLTGATAAVAKLTDPDAEPELDIVINNVVCSFSVACHLKLREIALNGSNVEYRRENGMVTMKLRRPYTTASIWSSGRITCTGATSETQAKIAARRYARCLNKLGFPTRFQNFRIVNVLGTCSMPWAIKIVNFSERHRENASYEPELHPGVTYKMREPKATLKIFSTGSITVTAASVNDVESAIQHIYPLVHEFRKQRSAEELQHLRQKQRAQAGAGGDSNELEDQLLAEAKTASRDDIFINTIAAHTNATRSTNSITTLSSTPINSVQRLEQYKQYHQIREQTQAERRHIPFGGNQSNNSTTNNSSSSDNICANARRRATECWASKLQNKRPRYNDPSAAAGAATATTTTAAAASALTARTHTGTVNVSAAVSVNRLRAVKQQPLMPVDVVLKQSSSRALNAPNAATVSTTAATTLTGTVNEMYTRRDSFSPTDFQVDDLIEEDDDEGLDMHF